MAVVKAFVEPDGCGEGFCGACTVLVNNEAVRSCQLPVEEVDGKDILTIEGLAKDGRLHPIQEAFVKHDALQCGFCTPGMILTAYSLLLKKQNPSRQDIIVGLFEKTKSFSPRYYCWPG